MLTALKEVEQALAGYAAQVRRRDNLNDAEQRSERAFKLADLRYRAGSIAYLDDLVAQNDFINVRLARV